MFKNFKLKDEAESVFKFEPTLTNQDKFDLIEELNGVEKLDQVIDFLSPNNVTKGGEAIKRFISPLSDRYQKAYVAFMVSKLIDESRNLA